MVYKHRLPRAKCQQPAGLLDLDGFESAFRQQKRHRQRRCPFRWWGKVDSNHRSYKQQIYSLSPLATREFPHIHFAFCVEPVDGLEPPTC